MSAQFQRTSAEEVYAGKIFSVWRETYRYADDAEETREIVRHPGAVGIVAHDDEVVWLVRQPREAVGVPDLLEIPAGKLDEVGEEPLQTAQRELAEEIGKQADHWQELKAYHSSVGFTDEKVHVFLAEGVRDADGEHDSGEDERIEIVPWPLGRLGEAIDAATDSKTLIGLLLLERRRA